MPRSARTAQAQPPSPAPPRTERRRTRGGAHRQTTAPPQRSKCPRRGPSSRSTLPPGSASAPARLVADLLERALHRGILARCWCVGLQTEQARHPDVMCRLCAAEELLVLRRVNLLQVVLVEAVGLQSLETLAAHDRVRLVRLYRGADRDRAPRLVLTDRVRRQLNVRDRLTLRGVDRDQLRVLVRQLLVAAREPQHLLGRVLVPVTARLTHLDRTRQHLRVDPMLTEDLKVGALERALDGGVGGLVDRPLA